MKSNIIELSTYNGKRYLRQEGNYIHIHQDRECRDTDALRINIPLFHEMALSTSERRSYKDVINEFFDKLRGENIRGFFYSKESLKRAGAALAKPGGRIAYLLGMFCRYCGRRPRNVNIVWAKCADCGHNNDPQCGKLQKCGDYYGCGKGVVIPLESTFKVETIPEIRTAIRTEDFPYPL